MKQRWRRTPWYVMRSSAWITATHSRQVSFDLMSSRTGCSGYAQTFIVPIIMMMIICETAFGDVVYTCADVGVQDYMPIYFQGSKAKSALVAGVDSLPMALVAVP
jgi:hypothetical protein